MIPNASPTFLSDESSHKKGPPMGGPFFGGQGGIARGFAPRPFGTGAGAPSFARTGSPNPLLGFEPHGPQLQKAPRRWRGAFCNGGQGGIRTLGTELTRTTD